MIAKRFRISAHVGGNEMVFNYIRNQIEPEKRYLRKDNALVRYSRCHDAVKGAYSVRCHEYQLIAKIVYIPDLAVVSRHIRYLCL